MNTTPTQLISDINRTSDEFFKLSQELAEIAERKGMVMLDLIGEHKTKAKAEIYWDATADGKREAYLKVYLKGLEKLRGARVLEYKANSGQL